MNKQEAIERIKNIGTLNIYDKVTGQQVDMVIKNQVLDIISQIDEPQKVVVPEFIGDLIKELKNGGCPIGEINENTYYDKVQKWIDDNDELFYRAWLHGYEVEKEKLYTVEIPDPHGLYKIRYLFRNSVGNIRIGGNDNRYIFLNAETHLTEAEIKKDFEWAWNAGFAKEVE